MRFQLSRFIRLHVRNRIELIYWDSGGGIRCDVALLKDYLEKQGFRVGCLVTRDRSNRRERLLKHVLQLWKLFFPVRLQIHLEQIHREQFKFSDTNFIFPNPEFTDPGVIPKIADEAVLCCKTRQAEALLAPFASKIHYTGFTSHDMYQKGFNKDYHKFLHLAGRSQLKGTMEILKAWKAHPEWPELTLVWTPDDAWGKPRRKLDGAPNIRLIQERISEETLTKLINTHGVHLCLSKTEGFGHYIVEALSAASVVVTTDGPPMNELVSTTYGYLVDATAGKKHFMNTLYTVDEAALETCISGILAESTDSLEKRGQLARKWYLSNDKGFKERFAQILAAVWQ
jgi:glycosyltransferase involved in cell wall biosynthesis